MEVLVATTNPSLAVPLSALCTDGQQEKVGEDLDGGEVKVRAAART
jgi:hypothetical protein